MISFFYDYMFLWLVAGSLIVKVAFRFTFFLLGQYERLSLFKLDWTNFKLVLLSELSIY